MKLILTNYVASLKEDKELDTLIQDILRQFEIEIIFQPQRGRQYGVDIYAVGTDPIDHIKKVFLVTVKKGGLDRNNWQNGIQSLRSSLEEIAEVFVRNNILPEHQGLPIKIIIAHNGFNDPSVQQNFLAFTEKYLQFSFVIWQLETIVNFMQERLISENVLSDASRLLFRKVLINLDDPEYDLRHFEILIDNMLANIDLTPDTVRKNIRLLRKISLVSSIAVSYCEDEGDTRLAVKVSEVTILRLAGFYSNNEDWITEEYVSEYVDALFTRANMLGRYIEKIAPVCHVKDGFSKYCSDAISYAHTTYEHLGIISLAGLEILQLAGMVEESNTELSQKLVKCATDYSKLTVGIFNNNGVIFSPRLDDYCIEINMAFLLLYKLKQLDNIHKLLIQYNNQMAHAKLFANVSPNFNNSFDEIYEHDYEFDKSECEKRSSSTLLNTLLEWTIVINEPNAYKAFVDLVTKVFKNVDLILWFPDNETQSLMFKGNAMAKTGYSLSNIRPTYDFDSYRNLLIKENENNSPEKDFYFFKLGFWATGLIAMRHFRNHIFPIYIRSLIFKP